MYEIDELRNKLDEAICGDRILIDDNDEPYISVYSVLRMLDEVAAQASERDRGLQKYMITKEDGACTVVDMTERDARVVKQFISWAHPDDDYKLLPLHLSEAVEWGAENIAVRENLDFFN